jgi:hypothetical protein
VPKSAYIDVRDYQSPSQLADYLSYLDSNKTAYNAYFSWRKYAQFNERLISFPPLCDMCIQLHLESFYGIQESVVHDIGNYWSKKENCKNPSLRETKIFEIQGQF